MTGETIGMPHDYDDDRLFVYLRLDGSSGNPDTQVRMLQEAGHPVVTFELRDIYDIGAEFYRWEFGTAVSGMILKINPFDELNVTESKNNTNWLLDSFKEQGRLPEESPVLVANGVSLYADSTMAHMLDDLCRQHAYSGTNLAGLLASFLSLARSGNYVALMAYMEQNPEYVTTLELIRRKIRHTFKRAETLGFGPRSALDRPTA